MNRDRPRRVVGLACLLLLAAGAPVGALASMPPLSSTSRSIVAREKPIRQVLTELFAAEGVSVTIAPSIGGHVSGAFEGSSSDIFGRLAKAFALRRYFDGRQLEIYGVSDAQTARFDGSTAQVERWATAVRQAGLPDEDNTIAVFGDHLTASGAARFVTQVRDHIGHDAPPRRDRVTIAAVSVGPLAELPQYRVFRLQNAWAEDMRINSGGQAVLIPGVASLLRSLVDEDPVDDAVVASEPPVAASPVAPERRVEATGAGKSLSAGLADLFGLAKAAADKTVPAKAAPPPPGPSPKSAKVAAPARPRIQADPRLNAVIIRDTPEHLAQMEALIAALDVEPRIVEIEASIIDVDVDQLRQSGVSFDFLSGDGDEIALKPAAPGATDATGQGLYISGVVGGRDKFMAKLSALETRGVARVTARPIIVTLSGVQAAFQNNQTFYVPVAGSLSTDLYNVPSGTMLRVTPHVSPGPGGERIRLLVDVEDGAISARQVGALPVVERSSLNTEAIVQGGQSLLVGGMIVESTAEGEGKVPFLADLPVAGPLFKARTRQTHHVERLFLITPRLRAPGAPLALPHGVLDPAAASADAPGRAS